MQRAEANAIQARAERGEALIHRAKTEAIQIKGRYGDTRQSRNRCYTNSRGHMREDSQQYRGRKQRRGERREERRGKKGSLKEKRQKERTRELLPAV